MSKSSHNPRALEPSESPVLAGDSRSLVLASTSAYRRELLARLTLPFTALPPDADEARLPGETPYDTARRLSEAKARSLSTALVERLIIGSDQVADLEGEPINKPGTHDLALEQLMHIRGRSVDFHTGIALFDTRSGRCQVDVVSTRVKFRNLPREALDRYLHRDRPYDCAGSAKVESLGIVLIESVVGSDPTAIIGLPLIRLTEMLLAEGVTIV